MNVIVLMFLICAFVGSFFAPTWPLAIFSVLGTGTLLSLALRDYLY